MSHYVTLAALAVVIVALVLTSYLHQNAPSCATLVGSNGSLSVCLNPAAVERLKGQGQ